LKDRQISYCQDSSNEKPDYLRNRIRLELIPFLLEKYNPQLVENLFEASQIFRADDEYLKTLEDREFERIVLISGDDEILNRLGLVANTHIDNILKQHDERIPIKVPNVLADIKMALGQFQEAIRTCEHALRLAIEHGEPLPLGTEDVYTEISKLQKLNNQQWIIKQYIASTIQK